MITLTGLPIVRAEAASAWQALRQDMRRQGLAFEYARFLEAGELHGALHWHFAQKGDYIPQTWLSSHAEKAGLGRVVDIRATYGAGPAWYMTKYITKGQVQTPEHWRKVSFSRAWPRVVPRERSLDWVLVRPPPEGV